MNNDVTGDDTSEITWMTYNELGQARGISAASAKRLAIRRRWRRHRGNDGTARVAVPVTEQSPSEAVTRDIAGDAASDITPTVRAFETALSLLGEQLERAEARIRSLEANNASLQADLEAARADARRAEATLDRWKARGLLRRLQAAWRGD